MLNIALIDIRTILLLLGIGNLIIFLLLVINSFGHARTYTTNLYIVSRFCQFIAWVLLSLRGQISYELSFFAGNSILYTGWFMEGLAMVSIRERRKIWDRGFLAGGVIAIIATYLNYRIQTPNLVIMTASFLATVIFVPPAAMLLLRKGATRLEQSMGLMYAVFGALSIFRGISAIQAGENFSLLTPALSQTMTFVTLFCLLVVGGFGYLLLLKEKIDFDLIVREKQLRQIIDLVPHFIFAKDDSGKFLLANKAVADAYGTTVEKLTGMKDSDFARSPEQVRQFLEDDRRVMQSGETVTNPEEKLTDSSGTVRYLSTVKIPYIQSRTGSAALLGVSVDITERRQAEKEREQLIHELQESAQKVKTLSGLLPLCASCKKIRNDEGYWEQMEIFIRDRSEADFSHGLCPDCAAALYPEMSRKHGNLKR
jgi:PAS domain S-box-containing protein